MPSLLTVFEVRWRSRGTLEHGNDLRIVCARLVVESHHPLEIVGHSLPEEVCLEVCLSNQACRVMLDRAESLWRDWLRRELPALNDHRQPVGIVTDVAVKRRGGLKDR